MKERKTTIGDLSASPKELIADPSLMNKKNIEVLLQEFGVEEVDKDFIDESKLINPTEKYSEVMFGKLEQYENSEITKNEVLAWLALFYIGLRVNTKKFQTQFIIISASKSKKYQELLKLRNGKPYTLSGNLKTLSSFFYADEPKDRFKDPNVFFKKFIDMFPKMYTSKGEFFEAIKILRYMGHDIEFKYNNKLKSYFHNDKENKSSDYGNPHFNHKKAEFKSPLEIAKKDLTPTEKKIYNFVAGSNAEEKLFSSLTKVYELLVEKELYLGKFNTFRLHCYNISSKRPDWWKFFSRKKYARVTDVIRNIESDYYSQKS